jgi:hypothetical protein
MKEETQNKIRENLADPVKRERILCHLEISRLLIEKLMLPWYAFSARKAKDKEVERYRIKLETLETL